MQHLERQRSGHIKKTKKQRRNSKFISPAELMENGSFHPKRKSDFHGKSELDWVKIKIIKKKEVELPA